MNEISQESAKDWEELVERLVEDLKKHTGEENPGFLVFTVLKTGQAQFSSNYPRSELSRLFFEIMGHTQ